MFGIMRLLPVACFVLSILSTDGATVPNVKPSTDGAAAVHYATLSSDGATVPNATSSTNGAAVPDATSNGLGTSLPTIPSLVPNGCHIGNNNNVTCIAAHAVDIPNFINSLSNNITNITIAGCDDVLSLNNISFHKFSSLVYLEISTCKLRNISRMTFQSLGKLQVFNLKNNHISSLDKRMFDKLPNLEVIDLSNNDLVTSLDKEIFLPLSKLNTLDLSNNRLTTFVSALVSSDMNRLALGGNPLSNAIIGDRNKTHACDIDLSYTGISELQASAFANINCTAVPKINLCLKGNFLKKVDNHTFDGLEKDIEKLDVSAVRWELTGRSALADFFEALNDRSVDYLDLSGCSLSEENVKHFPLLNKTRYLGTLDVSYNIFGTTIKTWPIYVNSLASVDTMECLNISSNGIDKGLVFNTHMPNLKVLDLSNNNIIIYQDSVVFYMSGVTTVPQLKVLHMSRAFGESDIKPSDRNNLTWFQSVTTLEELYLNDNYKLFDAHDYFHFASMFRGLVNLKNLSIAKTDFGKRKFLDFELEMFLNDQRQSLLNLDLSDNHIPHKFLVILKGLAKLEVLNLRSNSIGFLTSDWFNPNLRELDISDNSLLIISCTDTLSQALEWNLELMWIGDNPYDCSCSLADFVVWLKKHARPPGNESNHGLDKKVTIPDLENALCMLPEEQNDESILDYKSNWLICKQKGMILLGTLASVFLIVLLIAAVVVYNCRVNIQFCLRTTKHGHQILSQGVFMGYCDGFRDEDMNENRETKWVNDQINTNLEVCVDLPVAVQFMKPISVNTSLEDQIVQRHEEFRFILLIIGPLFIKELWENINTAVCNNEEVMSHCRRKFVLVLIENLTKDELPPSMKVLWQHGTCYTWPKSRPKQDIFWKRLKLKLSERKGICCC